MHRQFAVVVSLIALPLFAQSSRIASITLGTPQVVLGPDGSSINRFINGGISDEHQSVFAPGTLGSNPDYLFFVATRTNLNSDTGMLVLSGGAGPNANGQWTLDFAKSDGYDTYPSGFAQEFLSPVGRGCPTVLDGNPAHQDQTFDLNYAAPGSVVVDSSAPAGNLLMVYEGTITCFGIVSGSRGDGFYSTVGVATSRDYGKTWPTYRGSSNFTFVPLPNQNTTQGPQSPMGATGSGVCAGTDCTTIPSASYGRYAVLSPSVSLATAMASGQPLPASMGDAEMSAFVDDVRASAPPYLYVIYNYAPGSGALADPLQSKSELSIARAPLNGGGAPLAFSKWRTNAFTSTGIGGIDTPIFPTGSFTNCEADDQLKTGSSISYVEDTQQYLLTFVCDSPGDPASGTSGTKRGGAWFYSTSRDLSDPRQWTTPQEIAGSWNEFDTSGGCGNNQGWYPTLMSPGKKTGHLTSTGYVFYLWGCQTGNTPPPGRQYSSRAFTMTLAPEGHHRAARH